MKWFGDSWSAPACTEGDHTETPTGKLCIECNIKIEEGDQGYVLPYSGDTEDVEQSVVNYITKSAVNNWSQKVVVYPHICYHLDCLVESVVGKRR